MALHDGNGWVECRCGQRHWGRHGAAGLLLARRSLDAPRDGPEGDVPGPEPGMEVLLQLRAAWTHEGGNWALPGGARDSHEDAVAAALREAREEAGLEAAQLSVLGELPGVDHGDWSYTYVVARTEQPVRARAVNRESDELRWVAPDDVPQLPLHPAFGTAWPTLWPAVRARLTR